MSPLELPCRPTAKTTLLGMAICLAIFVGFGLYLFYRIGGDEVRLGVRTGVALVMTGFGALGLLALPIGYLRSRHAMLRLTATDVSIDEFFGRRVIRLADITALRLVGEGDDRILIVDAGKRSLSVAAEHLPSPADFDRVLAALRQATGATSAA